MKNYLVVLKEVLFWVNALYIDETDRNKRIILLEIIEDLKWLIKSIEKEKKLTPKQYHFAEKISNTIFKVSFAKLLETIIT